MTERDEEDIEVGPSPFDETEVSEDEPPRATDTEEHPPPPKAVPDKNPFAREIESGTEELPVPDVGSTIHDRYLVKAKLGGGAFGNVFRVQHRMLGQTFALKTLGGQLGRDPEMIAHFIEEAKATSLIGHENIVFVTDFGICPDYGHYLVMEYLDGVSLETLLEDRGQMSLDETVEFVRAIGNALSAVHELGIVHRDLKPANLMRSGPERGSAWKVVDFGISSAVKKSGLSGTPTYMPPEQALGNAVDGRADQFALAVIAFEMLAGVPPWQTRSWLDALPDARAERERLRLSDRRDDLPVGLEAVFEKALELDPNERHSSIEAFVTAFKSASDTEHKPTLDPFDVRETTRHLEAQSESEATDDTEAFGPSRSVVTHVDDVSVAVTFQSVARFKREYRRNIVAGGLFVPTNYPLAVRKFAWLRVGVEGYDKTAHVGATVVSNDHGKDDSPPGFGVSLDDKAVRALETLLRTLESGFDNDPDAPIKVRRHLDENAVGLSAAEAFFLSRMDPQMTVGRARAMFAALPFEFEETINSLLSSGHIVIGDSDDSDITDRSQLIEDDQQYSAEELARVIERADYFENQHNYLGASELLEEAALHAPESPKIHHRLARLRLRFEGDVRGASEAIQVAIELAPDDAEILATKQLIEMIKKRRS